MVEWWAHSQLSCDRQVPAGRARADAKLASLERDDKGWCEQEAIHCVGTLTAGSSQQGSAKRNIAKGVAT